jgi:membrane-bound serine protease (ClpP class)
MEFLLDPNVAYVVLLTGIVLAFLAAAAPGTGLFELGAVFCLFFAGYAIYNLSVHWWAFLLIVLSILPFVLALRGVGNKIFLAISVVLLCTGALFLFVPEEGYISINPFVAIGASAGTAYLLWFILRKSIEIMHRRPTHDLEGLEGQVGEAKTFVHADGSVYVAGELWSARSETEIPVGSHIRVVRREGFSLVVEKIDRS